MFETANIQISPEVLSLIGEIDEFKGAWRALGTIAPERLSALRRVATIESIGSSTRIEGSQLSDREVERLLANLEIQSFASRDEQEVAGYAAVMETIFHSWQDIPLTENHIKQLHRDLLQYSLKDDRHRGEYKKLPNNVAAFDDDGKQIAILFETATPFDTPRRMTELVEWLHTEELRSLHPFLTGNDLAIEEFATELARKNNLQLEWREAPEVASDAVAFAEQAERSAQLRRLIMLAVDADPATPISRLHNAFERGNELSLSIRNPLT